MSKIYLPNGARIVLSEPWSQVNEHNGNLSLYSNDKQEKFFGVITPAGVAHLTSMCPHTYYPPSVDNLIEAFNTVSDQLEKLSHRQLMTLKRQLDLYNGKKAEWK